MLKAIFVKEIEVENFKGEGVGICVFQHENNGIFAIDSSFLIQCYEDDETPIINDPFNQNEKVLLLGLD